MRWNRLTFTERWTSLEDHYAVSKNTHEKSLFVESGARPETQRQLNLYQYFLFVRELLRKENVTDVLEIGCGRGTLGLYLRKYLGLNVSATDLDGAAIRLAQEVSTNYGAKLNLFRADGRSLSVKDERFDVVISIGLVEHFHNPRKLFEEQFRALRKNGLIISLNVPQKISIQILNSIMRIYLKAVGRYKEPIRKDYFRNRLSAGDYIKLATEAGFEDVRCCHVTPFPLFTPVRMTTDEKLTRVYLRILSFRSYFQQYPYKTNRFVAQAHFIVGRKPAEQEQGENGP